MRQIPLGAKGSFSLLVQPEHLADRFKDAILPRVFATPVMIMSWKTPHSMQSGPISIPARAQDTASGLRALIAIHDTTLGPAFGGCRMYPNASEQHAMTDVLRLSRGMTYKAAICELPYGGGKSVIIADPRRDKTPALLHAMGRIPLSELGKFRAVDGDTPHDNNGRRIADLAQIKADGPRRRVGNQMT